MPTGSTVLSTNANRYQVPKDMARAIAGEVLAEFAARGTGIVEPDGEA